MKLTNQTRVWLSVYLILRRLSRSAEVRVVVAALLRALTCFNARNASSNKKQELLSEISG